MFCLIVCSVMMQVATAQEFEQAIEHIMTFFRYMKVQRTCRLASPKSPSMYQSYTLFIACRVKTYLRIFTDAILHDDSCSTKGDSSVGFCAEAKCTVCCHADFRVRSASRDAERTMIQKLKVVR